MTAFAPSTRAVPVPHVPDAAAAPPWAGRGGGAWGLGSPATRLLAGPVADAGPEPLGAHLRRLGTLRLGSPDELLDLVAASGLQGRGGGEFPVARKLAAARAAGEGAVVVANGSESEPASRKDRLLLEHRPHLVLDGLAVAARAAAATDAIVYLHGARSRTIEVVARAVEERRAVGLGELPVTVACAPDRFVAGEASAVVSFLEARDPRPRRSPVPSAVRGVHGRPTVVSNVESLAHLALLARHGAAWFRQAGSADAPGSTLVTLAGAVTHPGMVVEIVSPAPVADVLQAAGGLDLPPDGIIVGGYGGTWMGGRAARWVPLDRAALRRAGVPLGCGLLAPLRPGACGLALTARLLAFLAAESAGQCGSCVHGLPVLAGALGALARGVGGRSDVRRLHAAAAAVHGSGGCAHPDGAVTLLLSALTVFADDLDAHVRKRPCAAHEDAAAPGWFPTAKSLPLGPG